MSHIGLIPHRLLRIYHVGVFFQMLPSLKLTAKAPEHGWLEDDSFLLGQEANFFSRELLMEDIRLTNLYAKHPIIYRVFIHPRWFSRRISEPSKVCWFQGM